GDLKIRNHPVLEWPNRDDRTWGTPQHFFGLGADRQHPPPAAGILLHCDYRWLVADNTLTLDVDQGIGSAEVNCQVIGKPTRDRIKDPRPSPPCDALLGPSAASTLLPLPPSDSLIALLDS